jgi:hypothetical protein
MEKWAALESLAGLERRDVRSLFDHPGWPERDEPLDLRGR